MLTPIQVAVEDTGPDLLTIFAFLASAIFLWILAAARESMASHRSHYEELRKQWSNFRNTSSHVTFEAQESTDQELAIMGMIFMRYKHQRGELDEFQSASYQILLNRHEAKVESGQLSIETANSIKDRGQRIITSQFSVKLIDRDSLRWTFMDFVSLLHLLEAVVKPLEFTTEQELESEIKKMESRRVYLTKLNQILLTTWRVILHDLARSWIRYKFALKSRRRTLTSEFIIISEAYLAEAIISLHSDQQKQALSVIGSDFVKENVKFYMANTEARRYIMRQLNPPT